VSHVSCKNGDATEEPRSRFRGAPLRDCEEKLQKAMIEHDVTDADLALVADLKMGSFRNLKKGFTQSRRPQIAITNFLQTKIWPEIEITERVISLPAKTVIILRDKAGARFRREAGALRDVFDIHDTTAETLVTILKDTKLLVDLSKTEFKKR
jgi:hypothetical protein